MVQLENIYIFNIISHSLFNATCLNGLKMNENHSKNSLSAPSPRDAGPGISPSSSEFI
jgi:hypothetical protein